MANRPRQLRFPRLGERDNPDKQNETLLAEQYEIKVPRLGGTFLDWKSYSFDSSVTPVEAAREILERYDALVESGELPRGGKSGGGQSQPKFTSELTGITVFVRTIPSVTPLTDDDDDGDYADESDARAPRRKVFKYSVYTAVKLEYHIFRA